MRLDRFLSHATGYSRREVRLLIRAGRVRVGESITTAAGAQVSAGQAVWVDGRPVELPGPIYLMLHKPAGVVSATCDARQATVTDLLPADIAERVHPVGRLDKDTTGLLLLTDDGDWSHRVTSPRHGCEKRYRARLADPLEEAAEGALLAGVALRGDKRPARASMLEPLADREVRIGVTEGRYHLVRRMFAALGNRVTALHREQIGGLVLDPELAPGQWRSLTDQERDAVLSLLPLDYTV